MSANVDGMKSPSAQTRGAKPVSVPWRSRFNEHLHFDLIQLSTYTKCLNITVCSSPTAEITVINGSVYS